MFQSNALADATNATLTLANVVRTNSGYYSVAVTNAAGGVTSSNALLRVLAAQRILPLTSVGTGRYWISFADFDGGPFLSPRVPRRGSERILTTARQRINIAA